MIKLYSSSNYQLSVSLNKLSPKLTTFELHQIFPDSLHPRDQRICQLTLPPEKIKQLGLMLIGSA